MTQLKNMYYIKNQSYNIVYDLLTVYVLCSLKLTLVEQYVNII